MSEVINIGGSREMFWDEYLIETDKTTADLRVNQPVWRGPVLTFDEPWEGPSCDYLSMFKDGDIYRFYYNSVGYPHPAGDNHPGTKIAYMESKDGINWVKPKLGIVDFNGSKENNLVLWKEDFFDNFYAFRDDNPKALPEEKYKAVAECGFEGSLWGYTSPDAIHWTRVKRISTSGKFDTLNTCHWDANTGLYRCFIRDFHDNENEVASVYGIRDVRCITSENFWDWSLPVRLDFMGADDYALYTNNVFKYYRSDKVWIGFPTRYIDHNLKWTKNYDRLCGAERRKKWYEFAEKRAATTVTDCVFMSSRDPDTIKWRRFDEVWLGNGPENGLNWIYGDCYPVCGLAETKGDYEGEDNQISMYCADGKGKSIARLIRYTTRLDGFASYHATYKPQTVMTKPFIFKGENLKLNFRASAIGYVKIKVLDENYNEIKGFDTCEIFGDKVDRIIDFENGQISTLQEKPIRLEFTMSDAEIFSMIFE